MTKKVENAKKSCRPERRDAEKNLPFNENVMAAGEGYPSIPFDSPFLLKGQKKASKKGTVHE